MPKYTDENPLHQAVEACDLNKVRNLLDSGMSVDTRDRHLTTPLMIAARQNNTEIAALLLDRGADIHARERASQVHEGRLTALHHACKLGRVRMVNFLCERGADPDAITQSWDAPLAEALLVGNQPIADCLLERGATANGPEKCFQPPIVAAASSNNLPMIRELLRRGADPNRIGSDGMPALASTTSVECAAELLKHGADVNLPICNTTTPLAHRIGYGSPELIQLFINSGASVEGLHPNGVIPLMGLVTNPRLEVAKILLDAGANVNVLGDEGKTVLDWCLTIKPMCNSYEGCQRLAEFLRQHGAKTAAELGLGSEKKASRKRRMRAPSEREEPARGTKADDGLDAIRTALTSAGNYGLDTDSILARLRQWQTLCKLRIIGASPDTVEIEFDTLPADLDAYARDLYEFCPDLVEQGIGCLPEIAETSGKLPPELDKLLEGVDLEDEDFALELLKRDLQQTKRLRLWWD